MARKGGFVLVNTNTMSEEVSPQQIQPSDLPDQDLHWCSINLNEVFQRNLRLEASVYDVEGKHAREILHKCRWPLTSIIGDDGLANAYRPPIYKRIWSEEGHPYYLPSQITHLNPINERMLSEVSKVNFDLNRAKRGEILLTCSGTIGNCSLVTDTLANKLFSQNIIHLTFEDQINAGYVYAFIKTKTGQLLLQSNEYGAVISHIDPDHLNTIPIPNPPDDFKKLINQKIRESYSLRDEANKLLCKAEGLLYEYLNLPPLEKIKPQYFDKKVDLRNFNIKLSELSGRIDSSYHTPIINSIIGQLKKKSKEIIPIDNPQLSKNILLPSRFARVYVQEGQGMVFFGGKQVFQLDPDNKKYLSLNKHDVRIKGELLLKENMILITRSGTIGKVVLVPKHWEKWVANEHIIRVEPVSSEIAGYLYVFLASDYGHELITRFTYGAVVDEIDHYQVSKIPIPLLKDDAIQNKINNLALEANEKRTGAYYLEQEAIHLTYVFTPHKAPQLIFPPISIS